MYTLTSGLCFIAATWQIEFSDCMSDVYPFHNRISQVKGANYVATIINEHPMYIQAEERIRG